MEGSGGKRCGKGEQSNFLLSRSLPSTSTLPNFIKFKFRLASLHGPSESVIHALTLLVSFTSATRAGRKRERRILIQQSLLSLLSHLA